jgi:hypothetical protein
LARAFMSSSDCSPSMRSIHSPAIQPGTTPVTRMPK